MKVNFLVAQNEKNCSGVSFERFSIDEEVWETKGRVGVDFSHEEYAEKIVEAKSALEERLVQLLEKNNKEEKGGTSVVLDYSFWSAKHREEYRELAEKHGHKSRVIYFQVNREEGSFF